MGIETTQEPIKADPAEQTETTAVTLPQATEMAVPPAETVAEATTQQLSWQSNFGIWLKGQAVLAVDNAKGQISGIRKTMEVAGDVGINEATFAKALSYAGIDISSEDLRALGRIITLTDDIVSGESGKPKEYANAA